MKKILLAMMMLGSSNLMAANWKYIETNALKVVVYIDTESIQRNGDMVKYWTMYDLKNSTLQTPFMQDKFKAKTQQMTSCKRKEDSTLAHIFYYKDGSSTGVTKTQIHWQPIVPGTTGEAIYQEVCKGR